jgi:hypothetical protein
LLPLGPKTSKRDDFARYGFPFIDVASGGSVQGMIDAMEKATAQLPADVKVIPGHGAISNLDDVRAFTKMLKETSAVVQKALDDHKTLDQMKQEKIAHALGEMERRFRQRRWVYRDALQFAHRPQRRIPEAQLKEAIVIELSANVEASLSRLLRPGFFTGKPAPDFKSRLTAAHLKTSDSFIYFRISIFHFHFTAARWERRSQWANRARCASLRARQELRESSSRRRTQWQCRHASRQESPG